MNVRNMTAATLLLAVAGANHSLAQTYPERPVRVVLGLAPGGGSDTATRIIAHKLTDVLGQSFVVDNRPGAGSNIATEIVARAAPDGYTLLSMSPTQVINPSLQRNVRYHIVHDFTPIVNVAYAQFFLTAGNGVPANSVKELIALAKTQRLIYASSGIAGPTHLCAELFNSMAGITMPHVPYKSGSQSVGALLAGETHISFSAGGGLVAHMKAGRVKLLAVTGAKRSASFPDVPTIAELGYPGYEATNWYAFVAPAKTPKDIIERLNREIVRTLNTPETREQFARQGEEPSPSTPEELGKYIERETATWGRVVKEAGIQAQ